MSASSAASPLDDLASLYYEQKYGPAKNLSIIRSSSAIVSIAASSLLVWILFRSRHGISITYHRLLLGLSVSDILFSLGSATFGAVVPRELSYAKWNARGSRASCDAFGFLLSFGGVTGLLYMCSLNLYYLAKVKFNKRDSYIAKKFEPWLHLVPTSYGVTLSVFFLAKQGMNGSIEGDCNAANTYEPPHCDGYEDGETPEGFGIPCGRGRSTEPIFAATGLITAFLVPIIIGASLLSIYRSVLRSEQRTARYGVGALHIANDVRRRPSERSAAMTRRRSILHPFGHELRRTSNTRNLSQSRSVLQKAKAYSVAYFVTWTWGICYGFLVVAGAWPTENPQPKWQIAYLYLFNFFQQLQGLWNFLIYLQPDVIKKKQTSEGNISWFRAFADALWSAVTGRTNSAGRGRNQAGRGAPRTAAAPGRTGTTPAPGSKGSNTSATIGSTVGSSGRQGTCSRDPGSSGTNPLPVSGAEGISVAARAFPRESRLVRPTDEEEKCEIEPYEGDEEEKREIEPYEAGEGGDVEAAAGAVVGDGQKFSRGTVVGDGFECFLAHLRGRTAQGACTVVSDGFECFLAHLSGHTDPQGGLAGEDLGPRDSVESFLAHLRGHTDPQGGLAGEDHGPRDLAESFLVYLRGHTDSQGGSAGEDNGPRDSVESFLVHLRGEEHGPRDSGSSSYQSAREAGTSYFSDRETLSSYDSAKGAKSDDPNDE